MKAVRSMRVVVEQHDEVTEERGVRRSNSRIRSISNTPGGVSKNLLFHPFCPGSNYLTTPPDLKFSRA